MFTFLTHVGFRVSFSDNIKYYFNREQKKRRRRIKKFSSHYGCYSCYEAVLNVLEDRKGGRPGTHRQHPN